MLALGMIEKESLQIVEEMPHWIAVNKPAGLIVERNKFEPITIEGLVEEYLQRSTRSPFVGVIHRLDKVTSGIVIFAKKMWALKKLNVEFQERRVQKTYWAIITGALPASEGRLDHWLIKDMQEKRAQILTAPQKDAKKASLLYRIVAEHGDFKLVEIELLTGRYHQIRAQFAAVSCPIVGDLKYAEGGDAYAKEIALHARTLAFKDPQGGRQWLLYADLPENKWWDPFRGQL